MEVDNELDAEWVAELEIPLLEDDDVLLGDAGVQPVMVKVAQVMNAAVTAITLVFIFFNFRRNHAHPELVDKNFVGGGICQ